MNEATANRVLTATLSQVVDELLGYKYASKHVLLRT